ncbi:flagellar basal body-associated protein FliL [Bacillus sp. V59.32b]|uniref:flagellar basal body-associated protein FliL n=1 Tax=Bacillus sp. V59.32b TaxID=1758642 RepID=UPI000E3D0377|nr:flagellar basal body-associated protein FliL [Bacillus sp. V59.32b]RFU68895.1 flagellar basal body-associated protein FliL [Bacillus sp. V59.32b]
MMKNKLLTIMLIMLVAITLVGVIAIVVVTKFSGEVVANKEPSADEIVKSSVEIPEITTNLASGDFIKISFTVQTDNEKAKEELEKRSFQVKNIIITELSETKSDELKGKAGKEKFQETIEADVNRLMQEGQVEKVYITSSILQ